MSLRDRGPDGTKIGLRRLVDVVHAGLPPVEVAFVDRVEEKKPSDIRLAERELDRLTVVLTLYGLRYRLDRRWLASGVQACFVGWDLCLDAELVVVDRQGRTPLCCSVKGCAEQRDELLVVGERNGRRVRMDAVDRRDARVVLVGMDRERIHDRPRATACTIGGAEI